jgi:hypothetical protein
MNFSLTFIILFLLFFIYYINESNMIESVKHQIRLYIFNALSILFVLIFVYYSLVFGIKQGIFRTLIIWCMFVVATPIPEAGLLVSIPLKNIMNIDSFLALSIILYSYLYLRKEMTKNDSGKFLLKIIDLGSFSIFVICIVASIALSHLFDEMIDSIFINKKINTPQNMIVFILFLIPFLFYFYKLRQVLKI